MEGSSCHSRQHSPGGCFHWRHVARHTRLLKPKLDGNMPENQLTILAVPVCISVESALVHSTDLTDPIEKMCSGTLGATDKTLLLLAFP